MASADDPSSFASPDPSEQPSLDEFGPPHDHSISETLQLWILIPGLIGLILIVGEYIVHILLSLMGKSISWNTMICRHCLFVG